MLQLGNAFPELVYRREARAPGEVHLQLRELLQLGNAFPELVDRRESQAETEDDLQLRELPQLGRASPALIDRSEARALREADLQLRELRWAISFPSSSIEGTRLQAESRPTSTTLKTSYMLEGTSSSSW